jgi:hypothetical protein
MAIKPLTLNTDGSLLEITPPTTSVGAGSAGQIPALGSSGQLDISFMPTGIGADTQIITASESLSAGDFVHIWNNSGVANVQKALAADETKPANGFVLSAFSTSSPATVYVRGLNSLVNATGFSVTNVGKKAFLSPTTAGGATPTIPSTSGQISQLLGTVESVGSTVTINFTEENWTTRA